MAVRAIDANAGMVEAAIRPNDSTIVRLASSSDASVSSSAAPWWRSQSRKSE